MTGAALFFAAAVGNVCLLTAWMNFYCGHDSPRRWQKRTRLICLVLALALPAALFVRYGVDLWPALAPTMPLEALLAGYLGLCLVVGLVVFPAITLWRNLRPRPAVVAAIDSRIVDIAKHLGYAPIGDGPHRRSARLPMNQIFQVEFTRLELRLPGLPTAWDGLTVLHLTDLHLCGTPERDFFRRVTDLCMADGVPDLIAVTGDIVDSHLHHRWIIPILGRLRWGTAAYAILGNHDVWHDPNQTRRRLRKIGMTVLHNDWTTTTIRGEPLVVIGHEGPWFRPPPDLSAAPAEGYRLLLSHSPDNIAWARQHRVGLMLAGHTHGGQLRIPVIGSIFVPSVYGRRYDCGTFWKPPTVMHVGRGLSGRDPLRWFCRPQVTRLTLRAGG